MQISSKFTIGVHLLAVIDYLGESEKVTSSVLAGSIGVNPVIVRNVMGNLKEAGLISISQGKSGISLTKTCMEEEMRKITLADVMTDIQRELKKD